MLKYPVKINIKSSNKRLKNVLQNFHLYCTETYDENESQQIIQNIKQSNLVIINKYLSDNNNYIFIIVFKNTILFVQDSSIQLIHPLFSNNDQIKFYFIANTKDIYDKNNDITKDQLFQYTETFEQEIDNFSKCFQINHTRKDQIYQMGDAIKSCISGYLIGESYFKSIDEQKNILFTPFNKLIDQKEREESMNKEWTEDEYILLKQLGSGSLFRVELIYQIETGHLFAIKRNFLSDNETSKLTSREYENYLSINYPLIPKFYGKQKKDDCLIIQYIHGQSLNKVVKTLTKEDKIAILIELMLIIKYLHNNNYIYRDLKPNNVIIDENKTVFLIDFDRMIKLNSPKRKIEDITIDFQSEFVAPEINYGDISDKNDTYSLGMMMKYLELTNENDFINSLFLKCVDCKANQRPSVFEFMSQFYSIFIQHLNKIFIDNFPEVQYLQGIIYYEGKYISRDINKSIQYLTLAANQNYPKAQFVLGFIYYEGQYITRDINKSIYYFSLAANQNDKRAQHLLGTIYYENKYVSRDINKSIYYYSLAANQNDSRAQSMLGFLYYEGKYISRNINKSIHYGSLAANQNDLNAQLMLGLIYYDNKYVSRDINKSIYYFSLAANQNDPGAQTTLGTIYYENKYVSRDINKSIHYFSLAANQNDPEAQSTLGTIYFEGKYILRDIKKSIHYCSLAANQNDINAQFILGTIYYEDKYASRDINKSIYYFSLAANQNHPGAQSILGLIYYENKYILRDINKSIHYCSLAANQNAPIAQSMLGLIYYEGKYILRDINKSIYYFSLAANQNDINAQFILGTIYYENKFVSRDINKSIHYFSLAANQNHPGAQFVLGIIYYENKYVSQDINKSIHYYSLAANQNDSRAQNMLGLLYYEGKYISRNINKSIHYYSLAANQNESIAQFMLGKIYSEGQYISRDINKSIYYFQLAANQNLAKAQFILGIFYSKGIFYKKNMIKAIDYFIQSSSNGYKYSNFVVGYFYHEGKYVKRDIKKSIHHYKEASTFNNQYAKNNLGVIYRYGCANEIQQNCGLSMAYFEEAIQRFNDKVSMYNLVHIYIYEDKNKSRLEKSIGLLIKSIMQNFVPSISLLCIALIKLFGFNIEMIFDELNKLSENSIVLKNLIYTMIVDQKLLYEQNFEYYYQSLSTINYLYDFDKNILSTKSFNKEEPVLKTKSTGKNITQEFYEGFGILDQE